MFPAMIIAGAAACPASTAAVPAETGAAARVIDGEEYDIAAGEVPPPVVGVPAIEPDIMLLKFLAAATRVCSSGERSTGCPFRATATPPTFVSVDDVRAGDVPSTSEPSVPPRSWK